MKRSILLGIAIVAFMVVAIAPTADAGGFDRGFGINRGFVVDRGFRNFGHGRSVIVDRGFRDFGCDRAFSRDRVIVPRSRSRVVIPRSSFSSRGGFFFRF